MASVGAANVQDDVDLMMLDHLACVAIDKIIDAANTPSPGSKLVDEVNWTITPVKSLQVVIATYQPESALPLDLAIKVRIFDLVCPLWNYPHPDLTRRVAGDNSPYLKDIGERFLGLCSLAASKVSETRWFDLGTRFMIQAALEEHLIGVTRREALRTFYSWHPNGDRRIARWSDVRERYAEDIPDSPDDEAGWELLYQGYPWVPFKAMVMDFLYELMTTLDEPIFLQLELGQLGSLTPAETQQLKQRIGWR
ncbi:uncharacterized protein N7496_005294 [Penicillium cataractarum]|uniref:Uncharacterized protein n=1 Tax=Penicillium cataractarum TaxID=2100454 RepID=A0A9W9SGD3_9EURO|nr:uncharacterized protein N7496_005294 [Penicillium cataractarum]KAJ5377885.1 hypothetical protein N7496_005294 [Penicillium cataractarum]